MAHPLANDPTVPEALRRAYARVTHQIVRHYEDGTAWSWNLNRLQTPERETILANERACINTMRDGKLLVDVSLVEVQA